MISSIRLLLNQITSLEVKYHKISELSGENFNIFRILKLDSSEVRLHSKLLAELLNPKGSHGQKDTFLKLFVKNHSFKLDRFLTETASIKVEEHNGTINESRTEGGRIDIVIRDREGNCIVIENKLYAGDQDKQLVRYHNAYSKAAILYLTLDGRDASEPSRGELKMGIDYKTISYKTDILEWLELCRKESSTHPILRESLTQYINLIKHLTNLTINDTMHEELISLFETSPENIKSAFTISNSLNGIKAKLLEHFEHQVLEIGSELDLTVHYDLDFSSRYNGIFFSRNQWGLLNIGLQFQAFDNELRFGLIRKSEPLEPLKSQLLKDLNSRIIFPYHKPNPWWAYHEPFFPYENWKFNSEPWEAIVNGKMKLAIQDKISDLLEKIGTIKI